MGEDVEAGADPARDELRDQRLLVHDLAACGVDEARAVAKEREPPRVDETVSLRRERRVDRDDVRLREERVELAVLAEVGVDAAPLRVQHPQLEPARSSSDSPADSSE